MINVNLMMVQQEKSRRDKNRRFYLYAKHPVVFQKFSLPDPMIPNISADINQTAVAKPLFLRLQERNLDFHVVFSN